MEKIGKENNLMFEEMKNEEKKASCFEIVSSDENEDGILKPNHRPIQALQQVTTDFNGSPIAYKAARIAEIRETPLEEIIRLMPETPK